MDGIKPQHHRSLTRQQVLKAYCAICYLVINEVLLETVDESTKPQFAEQPIGIETRQNFNITAARRQPAAQSFRS